MLLTIAVATDPINQSVTSSRLTLFSGSLMVAFALLITAHVVLLLMNVQILKSMSILFLITYFYYENNYSESR